MTTAAHTDQDTEPPNAPDDRTPTDDGIDLLLTDPDTDEPAGQQPPADPAAAEPAQQDGSRKKKIADAASNAGAAFATWWGFVREPMAVAEAWKASNVIDARRVPANSQLLAVAWWWSNRTDRVLLFAILMVLPTFLNGPLLWCAVRPSRRIGLYAVLLVLFVVIPAVTAGG